ncbi:hypothetical protein NADFUDRAFT_66181 [Nadsonia fulvescens var. elongata DSM 6958]|uniref:F-box domain-containing protein n=1 Tax=Nadsonia fulvescens var. elongata DSM 6958 TaxID=857566 RepID=A0A1E3PI33_9ASCO|nr:hypothetical protein NADFUDRAFT_66181 [Nadsonia fulvescens var. elongata DSM 6958]
MGFIRGGVKRRKIRSVDPTEKALTPPGCSVISHHNDRADSIRSKERWYNSENRVSEKRKTPVSSHVYPVGRSPLELLPTETIQAIFVESQNFDLAQVSRSIYYSICGTSYLHKLILMKYIRAFKDFAIIPIGLLRRKFISRRLLEDVDLNLFIVSDQTYRGLLSNSDTTPDSFSFKKLALPDYLENGPFTEAKIELIDFLIPRFCFFQNPGKMFLNAVDDVGSPSITNVLLKLNIKPDWRSLLWAIKKGNIPLARQLVQSKLLDPSSDGLWIYVVKMRDIAVMKQLQQLGGSPSIEAIKYMNRHYDKPNIFSVKDLADIRNISNE